MDRQRLATWWIHWNDLDWPSPDNMDAIKRRAEDMANANVTTAVIFGTHFRWDYMPFFTQLHDYLATVAEELHSRGLKLYDHHSVNLIHRYDTVEEMRHVMLHSGPHLPFCPSREAAATWEYKGKKLNDWRMYNVMTQDVLYFPQYASEGFCHRNPEFMEAYQDYAKRLIADTGIDGLMADDAMHYMHFVSCGCPHCRAELKKRTGMDLPPIEDQSFWGNWENPAWKEWIDLRFDATGNFHKELRAVLPKDFMLMSCGASSATTNALEMGSDARRFLDGCNYVNLEMSGNTPPYKHDPVTVNRTIAHNMINASHHQAAAREKGVRCFGTGYGFTEPSGNIIWAVNKALGSDCWFGTLKARLGIPKSMWADLPEESEVISNAFTFEAQHPELFDGDQAAQLGIYFSYETRNHTCFGNMTTGYYKDYSAAISAMFKAGLSAHTVFSFPADASKYPLILLPSAASMTEAEVAAMRTYIANGGKVIITGPSPLPECANTWDLPTRANTKPAVFFSTIRDGVWVKAPAWISEPLADCKDPYQWTAPAEGILYNPHRFNEAQVAEDVLQQVKESCKQMPVNILESEGYFITMFENEKGVTVHFLAEDYDTDIDHHLDEIRFHRSRMNYVNKVEPIGISRTIRISAKAAPVVYTPFNDADAQVVCDGDICTITLPEKTSYALLHFAAEE